MLKGLGASSGIAKGKVKIIKNDNDIHSFCKGDILVTKDTNPGFTPIMSLAAGIITEYGGIISHAAIVSREMGIPCITCVQDATSILKDGTFIVMDGTKGTISEDEYG